MCYQEEEATPDRCSDGIIDDSPQAEQAAPSKPAPSKPAPHSPSHEDPAAVAVEAAARTAGSPPRKKAKHYAGGIPVAKPASSSFALQVSTHCPEGLESLAELMEVLSDLSDSSARQLRQQCRCSTAAGLRISVGDSAMEWSGAGNLVNASHHSSDILPVLKSLAARAVTALSLEHAGYKSVSDVEVRLQCDQAGLDLSPSLESPSSAPASNQREESPADVQLQQETDHDRRHDLPDQRSPEVPSIGSQSDGGADPEHDIQMGSFASKEPHPEAEKAETATATRPHWKDLPVWAADVNANTRELMQHWRGICKTLQSMKSTGLRAWYSMCHGPESEPGGHQPSVTASLDCHVDAFKTLLASREYEVVHLALRALRISTSKRVPSTLRGEGQLPTAEHFNRLLSSVQRVAGAHFKVAPLADAEEEKDSTESSKADHRLQPCRCLVCRKCAEKVAWSERSVQACPLCDMRVQWLADERALIATGWRVTRESGRKSVECAEAVTGEELHPEDAKLRRCKLQSFQSFTQKTRSSEDGSFRASELHPEDAKLRRQELQSFTLKPRSSEDGSFRASELHPKDAKLRRRELQSFRASP
eukprot:s1879_g6.t1